VARHLSFSAAAVELHLTQSAISRQIHSLEDDVGAPLFNRGTRHVELTAAGHILLRAVSPSLQQLDGAVQQIRLARGRRSVSLTTFASFASLWLIPRLKDFQSSHPDIDIRVSAGDPMTDLDDPEIDLALRYCHPDAAPQGAQRLFGEVLTPVVSPLLLAQGAAIALASDLAHHALLEEDDNRPSAEYLSWRHWLRLHGQPQLEPRRWIYLNFTYQQIQAALAGQGVALARLALVEESIRRGELVEPFGRTGRITSPYVYWLVPFPGASNRAELLAFIDWVGAQARATRDAIGEPD
jgi:LysR family glycine cleavage system transcriptional activator